MTFWTWVYMAMVWGAIIALNVYCFAAIFRKQARNHAKLPPPSDR